MKELVQLQKERKIKLVLADKTGGWVLTNFAPYKEAGDLKLSEKYVSDGGQLKPKYRPVSVSILKKHHKDLKAMALEGVAKGFICQEDGDDMVPKEPKEGRFYMNSKVHKPTACHPGGRL